MALSADYCGICGSALLDRLCADVLAKAMECENGHRYYLFPEQHSSDIVGVDWSTLDRAQPHQSDDEIIADRLRDLPFRSQLNHQIALVLLGIQARYGEGRRVASNVSDHFCFRCGAAVNQYDADWVRNLRCGNGHEVALRGEHVWLHDRSYRLELCAELPDETLTALAMGWVEAHPQLRELMPPSIRGVLERYLKREAGPAA